MKKEEKQNGGKQPELATATGSGLVRMEIELRYDPDLTHGNCHDSRAWFLDALLGDSLTLHSSEIGDEVGSVKVTQILSSTHLPKCIVCGGEESQSKQSNENQGRRLDDFDDAN